MKKIVCHTIYWNCNKPLNCLKVFFISTKNKITFNKKIITFWYNFQQFVTEFLSGLRYELLN